MLFQLKGWNVSLICSLLDQRIDENVPYTFTDENNQDGFIKTHIVRDMLNAKYACICLIKKDRFMP